MALMIAPSRGGKGGRASPSRGILQGVVPRGPAPPPEPYGVGMRLDPRRGLGVRQGRFLVQEEHQGSPLPQLILDRSSANDGPGPGQEVRREVRAIGRYGTGHGTHPRDVCMAPFRSPRSLPRAREPYSYFRNGPLSQAASLKGFKGKKKAIAKKLKSFMNALGMTFYMITRQYYAFNRNDFPPEVQDKL